MVAPRDRDTLPPPVRPARLTPVIMRTRDRAAVIAEMVERLAFAACGARLWPNEYARIYHRSAAQRMIDVMTLQDLTLIQTTLIEKGKGR